MPTDPQRDATITFVWPLGARLFRRLEATNYGMLVAVEATSGGGQRYQVVFRELNGTWSREWYYAAELDADDT